MRRSNDSNQMSLFADTYCDADLVSQNIIKPEEKSLVHYRCSGDNRGIIDCHSLDLQICIDDAGGLDLNTKPLLSTSPVVPKDLVVIPPECFDWDPNDFSEIVGINIKDLLTAKPKLRWGHYQLRDGTRISLSALERPVFKGKKIILFSSYIDVAIEKLWFDRQEISLFQDIAKAKFYAVTGMNFSLFLNECPLGQLINLNKSLTYVHELSKLGVPVIPHVYAVNDHQRAKIIYYLNRNLVNAVVINTQLQRDSFSSSEARKTALEILRSTNCNVILNGRNLKLPTEYSERVIVANQRGLKNRVIVEKAREKLTAHGLTSPTAMGVASD